MCFADAFPTPFRHADGSVAHVFSSYCRKTVLRHFQWMKEYGIDGAFVQRFAVSTVGLDSLNHCNTVLAHCREGANRYGRAYAVMYDLSGLRAGQTQQVIDDWKLLGGAGLKPADKHGGLRINCYGLGSGDPASDVFYKEGVSERDMKRLTAKKDTAEVVSAVSMDPQGIGFVDLASMQTSGQAVKVIAIGPAGKAASPSPETIKNAMYLLSERLFLYVHPRAGDAAKDFAKFVATCGASEATPYADTVKAVMETYQKHGLIPLADAAIARMAGDAQPAEASGFARATPDASAKAGVAAAQEPAKPGKPAPAGAGGKTPKASKSRTK